MGILVSPVARGVRLTPAVDFREAGGIASADLIPPMHATFLQKVILCMILGFFAACLIQWGKVFVTGADDALNAGYKHTVPGGLNPKRR